MASKMVTLNLETGVVTDADLTDPHNAAEAAIYADQERIILERYGEEAANMANYGWSVIEDEDAVGVGTKVYVSPIMILSSEKKLDNDKITHIWTRYR